MSPPAPDDWLAWWNERGERELRCILMTAWDPIGVGDAPETWGEYDEYARGLADRIREAADAERAARSVTAYLNEIERDQMEIATPESQQGNARLARSLVAWQEWSFGETVSRSRH